MTKKQLLSFKKDGYIEKIPKNENIDEYEQIEVKEKSGLITTLFRHISNKKKLNDISNFDKSWGVFNSLLNR